MNNLHSFLVPAAWALLLGAAARPAAVAAEAAPAAGLETLQAGAGASIGARKMTVRRMEFLPLVENEYSKVFVFDRYDNPKLKELREKEHLDAVVASGKDEFEKQVLLLDWTHRRFKKFGTPSSKAIGALEIIKAIDEGHTFFCAHYADVLCSTAASLGWVDRTLGLRRPANKGSGAPEHTITEIWSNQYRKWVMLDPTVSMYAEKDGLPLNAWEIRQDWYHNEGKGLTFVIGAERKKYAKKDLPVTLGSYPGFGNLQLTPDGMFKYAFLGYIPNTNLMDKGPDYGNFFITQDEICEGTKWHVRKNPKDPAHEPYFPLGQAAWKLIPAASGTASVAVELATFTPNFKTFQVRVDEKEWKECGVNFAWTLHDGANSLEARAVNQFGVAGPASVVELEAAR